MMTQIARDEIKMGNIFMFYDIYDNRVDFNWLFVVTSRFVSNTLNFVCI